MVLLSSQSKFQANLSKGFLVRNHVNFNRRFIFYFLAYRPSFLYIVSYCTVQLALAGFKSAWYKIEMNRSVKWIGHTNRPTNRDYNFICRDFNLVSYFLSEHINSMKMNNNPLSSLYSCLLTI